MATERTVVEMRARGVSLRFEPEFGMITNLKVERGGRTISMLHKAPWRDERPNLPPEAAPHLQGLAGDCFCAPFGDASTDRAPAHGWCANSEWEHMETFRENNSTVALFKLARRVMGAELTKVLRLVDDHPFVYQRHIFEGGSGTIPVANHAMVSLPQGGVLSFSPKRFWETPASPLESDPRRGRSLLRYPAQAEQPTRFPLAAGGEADLSAYPFADAHEDFAIGVEAGGSDLGWTTVARESEGDLFISLRNARRLPMTMLWFSNGGRDYAPWNSRHSGVLGVEEGLNHSLLGVSASQEPHGLEAAGVPTGLVLDMAGTVDVRHVIGSIPWQGKGRIEEIVADDTSITLRADGASETVPVFTKFLGIERLAA